MADLNETPRPLAASDYKVGAADKARRAWSTKVYFLRVWLRRKLLNWAFALHSDSKLVKHAENEMQRAGLYDADADYAGMLPEAVLDLVRIHSMQGHSGFSHHHVLSIFNKVVNFQVLTPITDDPDEWRDESAFAGKPYWQNKRQSSCFSNDGGKTYYDVNERPTYTDETGCYYTKSEDVPPIHKSFPNKKVSENASLST